MRTIFSISSRPHIHKRLAHFLFWLFVLSCFSLIAPYPSYAQLVINLEDPPTQLKQQTKPAIGFVTEYIATFSPSIKRSRRVEIADEMGAKVIFNYRNINSIAIRVANEKVLNALLKRPEIINIAPNRKNTTDAVQPAPAYPSNLEAIENDGNVELSWTDNSNDEDGFSIERCSGSNCTIFAEIGTTSTNINTFIDFTVNAGATYNYRVIAYRNGGQPASRRSLPSNTIEITINEASNHPPDAPTGLTVSNVTFDSVSIEWTDTAFNENGFRIYRCVGFECTDFSMLTTTSANTTAFDDTSVSPDTNYAYQVTAFNGSGESLPSNNVETKTAIAPVSTGNSRQMIPLGNQRVGNSVWTGSGVGIAIVDTGLDKDHPDLTISNEYYDVFGNNAEDDHGHGTHIGGIVAAVDNNHGIKGIAPGSTLYAVKVVDNLGVSDDAKVIAGLDWIASNAANVNPKISVVNISLGRNIEFGDETGAYRQIIQTLYQQGIVVVTSAGNDPTVEVAQKVPAAFPEVFAVAGTIAETGSNHPLCVQAGVPTLYADSASYFTTDGAFDPDTRTGVTVSAVSEGRLDINYVEDLFYATCQVLVHGTLSTRLILPPEDPNDPNTILTSRQLPCPADPNCPAEAIGTSFAAPRVSGVAALIIQSTIVPTNGIDVEAIRHQIRNSADRRDTAPINPDSLLPAPLDQLLNADYTFDDEREGLVQAP